MKSTVGCPSASLDIRHLSKRQGRFVRAWRTRAQCPLLSNDTANRELQSHCDDCLVISRNCSPQRSIKRFWGVYFCKMGITFIDVFYLSLWCSIVWWTCINTVQLLLAIVQVIVKLFHSLKSSSATGTFCLWSWFFSKGFSNLWGER